MGVKGHIIDNNSVRTKLLATILETNWHTSGTQVYITSKKLLL